MSSVLSNASAVEETAGPLSFTQQRLWFLSQLEPTNPTYNVPLAIKLSGAFNIERLRAALSALTQRHEPLRTSFRSRAGSPLQVIAPEVAIDLAVIELGEGSGDFAAEELGGLIQAVAAPRVVDKSGLPEAGAQAEPVHFAQLVDVADPGHHLHGRIDLETAEDPAPAEIVQHLLEHLVRVRDGFFALLTQGLE